MGNGVIPLMMVAMVPIITGTIGQRALNKRNAPSNLDYPDYPTKYDEYPVVVPKRAALLFDQLMVALQKVVDNQGRGELGGSRTFTRSSGPHLPVGNSQIVPSADEQTNSYKGKDFYSGTSRWIFNDADRRKDEFTGVVTSTL